MKPDLFSKIPFEKIKADTVLTTIDLLIELSKDFDNKLTTKQLQQIKKIMSDKYYNDKVELLEVLE